MSDLQGLPINSTQVGDQLRQDIMNQILQDPNLLKQIFGNDKQNNTIPGGQITGRLADTKFGQFVNKAANRPGMQTFNKNAKLINAGVGMITESLKHAGSGTYDINAPTRKAEKALDAASGLAAMIPGIGTAASIALKGIGAIVGGQTDYVNTAKVKQIGSTLAGQNSLASTAKSVQDVSQNLRKIKHIDTGKLADYGDIGWASSGNKVKAALASANNASDIAYNTNFRNELIQGSNLQIDKTMNELSSIAAFGGNLGTNSSNWSTGLMHIDNGSTHEKNPYEGVPMGADREGTPNLVEQGETIFDDYVFSDRLLVPAFKGKRIAYGKRSMKAEGGKIDSSKKAKTPTWEEKLLKKYGGLTFSAAAKKIEHDMGVDERPNDWIARQGMNAYLQALMNVQELERAKKELRRGGDLRGARELNKLSGYEFAQMQAEEQARQEQEAIAQQQAAQQQQQQMMAQQQGMDPQQQMDPNQQAMMQQQMMAQQGAPMQAACGGRLNKHDEGGNMQEEQSQQQEETSEDPMEKDPSDMSNKELNDAIKQIIEWAQETEDKQLLARAEKAKKGSREEKEAFVEDAIKQIEEESSAMGQQAQQEQQQQASPEEQAMMEQQAMQGQLSPAEQQQQMSPEEQAMMQQQMQQQMMAAQGGQPMMAYGGRKFADGGDTSEQEQIASMYYSYLKGKYPKKYEELQKGMSAYMQQYASQFQNLPQDKQELAVQQLQLNYLYNAASKDNEFLSYIKSAQQAQYADGGELAQEDLQQQPTQDDNVQEMQVQSPEFLSIEDPTDLSTKELNKVIDEILQYARENKIKDLAKAARKAKRGSREDKEDFIEDAIDEVSEIEEQKAQEQQAEQAQEPSPEEQMVAQQQQQQPSEEELAQQQAMEQQMVQQQMMQQQGAMPADPGNELEAQMQPQQQQFAYGGKVNKYSYGDTLKQNYIITSDVTDPDFESRFENILKELNYSLPNILPADLAEAYQEYLKRYPIIDPNGNDWNGWQQFIKDNDGYKNYSDLFKFFDEKANWAQALQQAKANVRKAGWKDRKMAAKEGIPTEEYMQHLAEQEFKENNTEPTGNGSIKMGGFEIPLENLDPSYINSEFINLISKYPNQDQEGLLKLLNQAIMSSYTGRNPLDIPADKLSELKEQQKYAILKAYGMDISNLGIDADSALQLALRQRPYQDVFKEQERGREVTPLSVTALNPNQYYSREGIGDPTYTFKTPLYGGSSEYQETSNGRYKVQDWGSDFRVGSNTYPTINQYEMSDPYLKERYFLAQSILDKDRGFDSVKDFFSSMKGKYSQDKLSEMDSDQLMSTLFGRNWEDFINNDGSIITQQEFIDKIRSNPDKYKDSPFLDHKPGQMHRLDDLYHPSTNFYYIQTPDGPQFYNQSDLQGAGYILSNTDIPEGYNRYSGDKFYQYRYNPLLPTLGLAENEDYINGLHNTPIQPTQNVDAGTVNGQGDISTANPNATTGGTVPAAGNNNGSGSNEQSGNGQNPDGNNGNNGNLTDLYYYQDAQGRLYPIDENTMVDADDNRMTPTLYMSNYKGGTIAQMPYTEGNNRIHIYTEKPKAPLPGNLPFWLQMGLGATSLGVNVANAFKPDYKKYRDANALIEASKEAGKYQPVAFRPIGDFVNPSRFNMNYWADQQRANALATQYAILNSNNGNLGSINQGLLANGYNTVIGLGDLARKGQEYNTDLAFKEADFNRETNKSNSEGLLKADMANQAAMMDSGKTNLTGLTQAYAMKNDIDKANEAAINASVKGIMDGLWNVYANNISNGQVNYGIRTNSFGPTAAKVTNGLLTADGGFLKSRVGLSKIIGG